jgi:GGDEF domain-containing protein
VALAILSPAFQGLKQRAPPTAKTVSATMLACHWRTLYGIRLKPVLLGGTDGLAVCRANDDADHLLRAADHAMYKAKASGKDRVCFSEPASGSTTATPDLNQLAELLLDSGR